MTPVVECLVAFLFGSVVGLLMQRSRFCNTAALRDAIMFKTYRNTKAMLMAMMILTVAFTGFMTLGAGHPMEFDVGLNTFAGLFLFGIGMVLARGCSSRLLVLAAQGNLRALLSGLVFAVTAQSALSGLLSPLRTTIAGWWTVEGGAARDLLALTGVSHGGALLFGAVSLVAALVWARRQQVRFWGGFGAVGVGVMVASAWLLTWKISSQAFDLVVPVQSLSFTGPAADMLMLVLSPPGQPLKFDLGLVPGVAAGAFLSALLWRELKLEGFQGGQAMRRYIVGAILMGFGGMLAGGCAVGAGVSGAAVFTLTSWVTLCAMWAGAALTDRLVDGRPSGALDQPVPGSQVFRPHGAA